MVVGMNSAPDLLLAAEGGCTRVVRNEAAGMDTRIRWEKDDLGSVG